MFIAKESLRPPERRPSVLSSSRGYDETLPGAHGRCRSVDGVIE